MSNPYETVSQIMAERDQLRAELSALKAGQSDPIAYRWAWKESREDDGWTYRETLPSNPKACIIQPLYAAPPASADTVSVAPGLERAIQIVREVAKTQPGYSDEREAIFEALSEAYVEAKAPQPPPASADAVLVSAELLKRVCADRSNGPSYVFKAIEELRALLAQSESKGMKP